MNNIKTLNLDIDKINDDFENKCSICYETLYNTVTLSKCDHKFCLDCISKWISSQNETCPYCRTFLFKEKLNPSINDYNNYEGIPYLERVDNSIHNLKITELYKSNEEGDSLIIELSNISKEDIDIKYPDKRSLLSDKIFKFIKGEFYEKYIEIENQFRMSLEDYV